MDWVSSTNKLLLVMAVLSWCGVSHGSDHCNRIIENTSHSATLTVFLHQLTDRIIIIDQLLGETDNVTARQGRKILRKIVGLTSAVQEDPSLTEVFYEAIIPWVTKLDEFENRLNNLVVEGQKAAEDFSRLLTLPEPIDSNQTYWANLPKLGFFSITILKSVAKELSPQSIWRTRYLPAFFKGLVPPKGNNGIKYLDSIESPETNKKWSVYEIKVVGKKSGRIMILRQDQQMLFYKIYNTHELLDSADIMGDATSFLRSWEK